MNKKLKIVFMIVLICLLFVLLSISVVTILNKYSIHQNSKLKRDSSIVFTDIYGFKLLEGNEINGRERVRDTDKEKLMEINLHRNSEDELKKMLKNYISSEVTLDDNYTAYDLRIDIVEGDPYAEKFEVPELPGVYTFENIKLMKAIKQNDYSIMYRESSFVTADLTIKSNGEFSVEHFELSNEERFQGDSGRLDDKAIEDVLIKAVKLGFFKLPREIMFINPLLDGYPMYTIRIGEKTYEVGGGSRSSLDDVYYKVHGSLQKIIHEKTEMYYEFIEY